MNQALDTIAPSFYAAKSRWPDASNMQAHYADLAETFEKIPGTDCHVVYGEQRVSVTPLRLDLTDEARLEHLARWKIDEFERA